MALKSFFDAWAYLTGASVRSPVLDQVPVVSIQVLEHGDSAVGLVPGFSHEGHALGNHGVVVTPEVIGAQKKEDTTTGLVTYSRELYLTDSAGEQEAGFLRTRRSDDDPAFVLLGDVAVLDELEAEYSDEEPKGFVIITDYKRGKADVLHRSPHYTNAGMSRCPTLG